MTILFHNDLQNLVNEYGIEDELSGESDSRFRLALVKLYVAKNLETVENFFLEMSIEKQKQKIAAAQSGKTVKEVLESAFEVNAVDIENKIIEDYRDYWEEPEEGEIGYRVALQPAPKNPNVEKIGDYYYDRDRCKVVGLVEDAL